MKAKIARICSVVAVMAGISMLGGSECVFNIDEDDGIFDKAATTQQQ